MPTYVDEPRVQRRHGLSGHLVGEPPDDAHAVASAIGLGERYWQGEALVPHYALPAGRRDAAIAAGAVALDERRWAACVQRLHRAACSARMAARPAAAGRPPAPGPLPPSSAHTLPLFADDPTRHAAQHPR